MSPDTQALLAALARALAFAERVRSATMTFADGDEIDAHAADLWNTIREAAR
jgi:hypothetical protein